jgi:hypothetical protein
VPNSALGLSRTQRQVREKSADSRQVCRVGPDGRERSKQFDRCVDAAVKNCMIARNPCEDVQLRRVERREKRFLTPGQVSELADVIDPRYRNFVLVGAYGGLDPDDLVFTAPEGGPLGHRVFRGRL